MSNPNSELSAFPHDSAYAPGLTKREYFAAMAMQGLLSAPKYVADRDTRYDETNFAEVIAMNSVEFADAVIAELAKEKA